MARDDDDGARASAQDRDADGEEARDHDAAGDARVFDVLRAMARAPALDLAPHPDPPRIGQRLSHFLILEPLGAGGMGVVYKARDLRLERLVALKVLSPRYVRDPKSRSLLLREARSAAAVSHPSIAAIYEIGEAEGVDFIAMELVVGATLRARLRSRAVPFDEALAIAFAIASGLARAHRAGIVHRDLKPDNVMVGEDGQVKILDFGLARPVPSSFAPRAAGARAPEHAPLAHAPRFETTDVTDHEPSFVTEPEQVLGTPAYMSPEQRAGTEVDARSDVFSFGVLFHELLTSRLPRAADVAGIAESSPGDGDPAVRFASDRALDGEVPVLVAPLLARCLAKDREARFTDGAALEAALSSAGRARSDRDKATAESSRLARRVVTGTGVLLLAALCGAILHARARPVPLAPFAALAASSSGKGSAAPTSTAAAPIALRRVTANPAENPILHAAIAPDGQAIAYVDKSGAYIQGLVAKARAPLRIDLPEGAAPELVAWTPGSDRLVVSGQRPSSESKDLWLVTASGATLRALGHGDFTGLAVSPDGARLAFAEEERVSVMALDETLTRRELTRKAPGCFITELAFSPDGGRIAYESLCFSSLHDAAIESVDFSGGAPVVAVADARLAQESGVGGMAWTAGGRLVYALAEWFPAESGANLWSVDLDARSGAPRGAARKLTDWASTLASVLSVDRAGRRLAFLRFEFQADVYVGDLEGGGRALRHPRRLTMTDRNERPAAWSSDGKGVYFISDRNGLYDVFYQLLGGGEARVVLAEPGSETGLQLAPRGDALLYWQLPPIETPRTVHPVLSRAALDGEGRAALWTAEGTSYPEGAGRPQPWEMRFRCARVPHGACVLSKKEGAALVFRVLDPERGPGAELRRVAEPTAASFFWDLSPDGTRTATPSENGPVRIETVAGAFLSERRVPSGCDPIYVTWAADGRALFVSAECSNAPVFRLYFLPEQGPSRLLWDASPDWLLSHEASPDGKHLAIAVKHADNDVWLLDDLP